MAASVSWDDDGAAVSQSDLSRVIEPLTSRLVGFIFHCAVWCNSAPCSSTESLALLLQTALSSTNSTRSPATRRCESPAGHPTRQQRRPPDANPSHLRRPLLVESRRR